MQIYAIDITNANYFIMKWSDLNSFLSLHHESMLCNHRQQHTERYGSTHHPMGYIQRT